jgi:hypothetical protein
MSLRKKSNLASAETIAKQFAHDLMRSYDMTAHHVVGEIYRNQTFAIEILALKCGWFKLSEELENWRNQTHEREMNEAR